MPRTEQPLPEKGRASWTAADILALINFLIEQKSKAGDNGQFKGTEYRAARDLVNKTRTTGGPKTEKSCRTKYLALRKMWQLVDLIINTSGWTWDTKTGVTVNEATQGAWDAFVRQYPEAEQFENKGWPYHEALAPLMPTKAKGSYVYRPNATPSVATRSSSPTWDDDFNRVSDDDDDDDGNAAEGSGGGVGDDSEGFDGSGGPVPEEEEDEEENDKDSEVRTLSLFDLLYSP
ncbi:hypothetical protein C8R47DRAFT_995569 [Mycena vitilis]|nr:hypothetical protein C8R47DRAFT_995569 [Mycena vitilis]